MITLTMFTTEKDLSKLTGLNHDQLWNAGFDLDDWNVGFCSDIPMTKTEYYDDGDEVKAYQEPIMSCDWLFDRMDSYCCGYKHTEYNRKHYYMVYHS